MEKFPSQLLFLSHAAADKELVEAFETFLTKCLNITSERIFCSSLEGQGAKKGANFVDEIKDKATEAHAVVALITPAYIESAFCLAELGAAWVLNTHRFPIVVPPNTFQVIHATLLGVVGVKLDDQDALAQMLEDIGSALSLPPPKAGVKTRAMREFFKIWPTLKIGKAKLIKAEIHDKALADLKSAREAWEASEDELDNAKAHIKALKKLKDADHAAEVSKKFEDGDWEMDLDNAISIISGLANEVGGNRVIRHMILEIMNKPSAPDLNDDYIARAVEIDVYDHETRSWNHSSDEMKSLVKAMARVDNVFQTYEFAQAELKRKGKRYKTDDIRFWEQQVGI